MGDDPRLAEVRPVRWAYVAAGAALVALAVTTLATGGDNEAVDERPAPDLGVRLS